MRYSIARHCNDIIESWHSRRVLHINQETTCHTKLWGRKLFSILHSLFGCCTAISYSSMSNRLPVYDRLRNYVIHLSFLKDITWATWNESPKKDSQMCLKRQKCVCFTCCLYLLAHWLTHKGEVKMYLLNRNMGMSEEAMTGMNWRWVFSP